MVQLCELALTTQREPDPEPEPRSRRTAALPDQSLAVAGRQALVALAVRPSQLTYGKLPLWQLKLALEAVREHGAPQAAARFVDLSSGGERPDDSGLASCWRRGSR